MSSTAPTPVHLLRGDDPSLLRDAVRALVAELVGDGDRELMVEELAGDEYEMAALVDAAQTPPFLTERRVVVARDVSRFSKADDVAPLVAYLADPLPTTSLVLVWDSGRVPKNLADAIKKAGGSDVDTGPGRKPQAWVDEQLAAGAVTLDARARRLVADQLGEQVGRLAGLLATLESTYGPGAKLGVDEVTPFLGEAGAVPPWELTDAIDRGDVSGALDVLHRMLGPGERHPLQLMAMLQGHYGRMLRLDGEPVQGEKGAAEVLGMRGSTFPARKALDQARRLGHDRIADAIRLLARADLDLRGVKDWPEALVMEVLVARLARLAASGGRPAASRR